MPRGYFEWAVCPYVDIIQHRKNTGRHIVLPAKARTEYVPLPFVDDIWTCGCLFEAQHGCFEGFKRLAGQQVLLRCLLLVRNALHLGPQDVPQALQAHQANVATCKVCTSSVAHTVIRTESSLPASLYERSAGSWWQLQTLPCSGSRVEGGNQILLGSCLKLSYSSPFRTVEPFLCS